MSPARLPPSTSRKARARPAKRAPGRPSAAAGDQRDALLDAAKKLFARDGFARASLREIAREAHVTPALASYYFGDKPGLLAAVIEQRVAPLVRTLLESVAAAGPDPRAALSAFVRTYTATAARNPWLPQLIVREVLSEQGVLRDTFVNQFAGGMTSRLRAAIEAGQLAGVLRRDLEPAALVMSLISLCVFPFIATPLVSGALGLRVDEAHAAQLAEHHLSLFLRGAEMAG